MTRGGLDDARARGLLEQVAAVSWGELHDAYGPADDVAGQLAGVIAGDDDTRNEAWWNLWGNIHHQGTIYEATVPAVPILFALAAWREHPDRAEAILMLREIGAAKAIDVWRYDAGGRPAGDEAEQQRLYPQLRALLTRGAEVLLDGWRDAPGDVRRAMLWLLSVLPDLRARHEALVAELLPVRHRRAWALEVEGSGEGQEEADAVFALQDWIFAGGEG